MDIDLQQLEIVDNPAAGRFEAHHRGELLGYLTYEMTNGVMRLPHTYVMPPARGQNIAAMLVQEAMETARSRNASVMPICWYVEVFMRRHPEYQDLLADPSRIAKSS